ncbi:MAG: diaminopimelate epimerase [Bacteroidetes bacterium]|nr:diaminopimelate epimerase [Bacteroidota bacterium]
MKTSFVKMSGAGNDFVVVDNRDGRIQDAPTFARKVCERRFGIGADGLLLLEPSENAAFTMKYYNADGSNAGMCGNGGRCLARFGYDLGITGGSEFDFDAFGHRYTSRRINEDKYELKMKDPFGLVTGQRIDVQQGTVLGNYINTGTDHSVVFMDENAWLGSLETMDVHGIGRQMRYHSVYAPIGANINYIEQTGTNSIKIRTYERGVEDETLACGTGSVASAVLSAMKYKMKSPVAVMVRSGEVLEIGFDQEAGIFRNVRLTGSAVMTFAGIIDIE